MFNIVQDLVETTIWMLRQNRMKLKEKTNAKIGNVQCKHLNGIVGRWYEIKVDYKCCVQKMSQITAIINDDDAAATTGKSKYRTLRTQINIYIKYNIN